MVVDANDIDMGGVLGVAEYRYFNYQIADQDGTYLLQGLPTGSYYLKAENKNLYVDAYLGNTSHIHHGTILSPATIC